MKKLFAILLAVMMIAALAVPAFAAETVTVTVNEPTDANTTPETYTAYKILSATKIAGIVNETNGDLVDGTNGITYYTTEAMATALGTTYFTFAAGKVGEDNVMVAKPTDALTANNQDAASALLAIAKAQNIPGQTVNVGEATTLDIGYYVIESSLGTQLILLTTDQTIEQKNVYPSFTKSFDATPENDPADSNAAIGDTIEYKLDVVVPATVKSDIVIHDTLDAGLEFVAMGTVDNGTATVNEAGTEFTIPSSNAGKTVTIHYTAKLTTAARSGNTYKNTAYLTYSNFQSETQKTETKTNKITVTKVIGANGQPTETLLAGATLQLQKADGTVIPVIDDNGTIRVAVTGETGEQSFVSNATAAIVIEGIDSDYDYQVVELAAPAGYNALTTPQSVTKDEAGDGAVTIANFTGSVLPSTGGIGTTIFYVIGGVMVLAAGVLLITKKRLSQVED